MSATEHKHNGIHVFVFCCADYKNIINDCVNSIDQFIIDPIISRNIVSNTTINIDGYNLIQDKDFWKLLDPEFKYRNLYNHNWIKQQIFKLNLDKIVSGNILIIDAEVRFRKPLRWITDTKCTVFYTNKLNKHNGNEFVKQALDIDPILDKTFIVEATIFNTDILKEIQDRIVKLHSKSQLAAYQTIVFDDPTKIDPMPKLFFSEYELYANYLLKFHSEKVDRLLKYQLKFFNSIECETTSNSTGNVTKWLTQYEQIRGTNWPDCESKEDFANLPDDIKQECIEKFGYNNDY